MSPRNDADGPPRAGSADFQPTRFIGSNLELTNGSDPAPQSKDGEKDFDLQKFESMEFTPSIRWPDLIVQISLHLGLLYGLYLACTQAMLFTVLFALFLHWSSGVGITAGAHRLWSHRAYRAAAPLRILLVMLFTIAGQRDVYTWALDHRVHHKYSETVADPHDVRRGFFFAHVGWLVLTPHPAVVVARKHADVRDLQADPIVMWQKRWYVLLFALMNVVIPIAAPVFLWGEDWPVAFFVCFVARFTVTLNVAYSVNSVAHMWGNRPYDKNIGSSENIFVSLAALGEGWHNYHHVFPWDYKTAELGHYLWNTSTSIIDAFARIGWAFDRKSVSPAMVARRAARTGDGSTTVLHDHHSGPSYWGYGDPDIPTDDLVDLKQMSH